VRDARISIRFVWDRSVTLILIFGICLAAATFQVVRDQEAQGARDEFRLAAGSSEYAVRREIESNLAALRALRTYLQITPNFTASDIDHASKELIRSNPAIVSLKWVRGSTPPAVPATNRSTVSLSLAVFEGAPGHERVRGYAVGTFRLGEIFEKGLRTVALEPIDVDFYDTDAPPGKQFLYEHPWKPGAPVQGEGTRVSLLRDTPTRYKTDSQALKKGDFKEIVRLDADGRHWAMVITPTEVFMRSHLTWLSWKIVAALLIITGMGAAHFLLHVARVRTDHERMHLHLRRSAEDALRMSEERYALAARGSKDGLWDWDLQAGLIFYSERWKSMLGFEPRVIGNSPAEWLGRLYPADRARVEAEIADHCAGKTDQFQSEYRILHNDGSYHWMLSRGVAVVNGAGEATRLAGSQTDITESKAADSLTGLASRLLLDEKLQLAIEDKRMNPEMRFAVLFLDLDRFKVVNDSLGHLAGDQLLLRISRRLLACVAEAPFCDFRTLVARLGGDEFVILISGMSQGETAIALANRIQERMMPAFNLEGHHLFVSASIGLRHGQSDSTPANLLLDADTAMYHAKTRGRERYEVFAPSMRLEAVERLQLETDLRTAIENDELVVYYQPKVCLSSGKLIEVEALVRWMHPKRGLVGPGSFIPLAEETGLILPLGECVLRKSCIQMAAWLRELDIDPAIRVSVNLSGRQFKQPDLFEQTMRILEETGLPPERLSLEVTEGVLMDNFDNALLLLNRLRAEKIGLQLDDFGTGYSSLSYLRRLPFDGLKIDKSFVQEAGVRHESAEIVATITLLARALGMKALAEGVETLAQLQMLIRSGCDHAQGNLFSAAVDAETSRSFFGGFEHVLVQLAREKADPVVAGV